jgi:O-antigen ligase
VLWNSSHEPWLRGYGLTAHPNLLGAMLAILLLWLLTQGEEEPRPQQLLLSIGWAVGLLGLLVSFSRTSWLAFLGGLLFWATISRKRTPPPTQRPLLVAWLPLLTVPLFLLLYHDLIFNRLVKLDTLIEARSIHERLRDAQVALYLIAAHPWIGVGAGNALEAAQSLRAGAGPVHNVLLLVTVELGLLGGVCFLLFMLLPLLKTLPWRRSQPLPGTDDGSRADLYGALWIGLLIAGLFDTPLWLTTSWRAALLLGILAAMQAQIPAVRKVIA